MVERLKIAVEKARAARNRAGPATAQADPGQPAPTRRPETEAAWAGLEPLELDARRLERNRIVTQAREHPSHVAFDVLRTRLLRAFRKHGWTRLGITSPTKGCGKTFTAVNLAISLSRQRDCRTILMDMDLRAPSIAKVLGVNDAERAGAFLSGMVPAHEHLRRHGANLALGLNAGRVPDAGEVMQAPRTGAALESMLGTFAPDIVIYDLPPMLSCDDVLGFLGQLDCVLLIVGGGITRPAEVSECERLLADNTHLLGVLLNRAEGVSTEQYGYESV